jgi:hypothetical protein
VRSILHELQDTQFFRLIQLNLDGKCLYWDKAVAEEKCANAAPANPFFTPFSSPMSPPPPEGGACALAAEEQGPGWSHDFGQKSHAVDSSLTKGAQPQSSVGQARMLRAALPARVPCSSK